MTTNASSQHYALDTQAQMRIAEYRDTLPTYNLMLNFLLDYIKKLLQNKHIVVNGLEGRVKTEKSLTGKLLLKGQKYQSILDITDIVGIRIITFYQDEVDKIAALMESCFTMDWQNTVDKRAILSPDKFGYLSLHYVCKIPKALLDNPDFPLANEIRFEIQMRTALQHIWASIYHDIGYKNDIEVPKKFIRALTRLAGLLEIGDVEFMTIRKHLEKYRRNLQSLISHGQLDEVQIDGDSFKNYMQNKPFSELMKKIASINHSEIIETSPRPYLNVFPEIGIHTLADLENLRITCEDEAYKLACLQLSGMDLDILSSNLALQNLCFVYAVKSGRGENGILTILDTLTGVRPSHTRSAKRLFQQISTILPQQ